MRAKLNHVDRDYLIELYLNQEKSITEIAEINNCSIAAISIKIKQFGLKPPVENKYVGNRFGSLLVTEFLGRDEQRRILFRCLCDCGNVLDRLGKAIITGNVKSCGCNSRKRGKDHANFKGYEEIPSSIWWSIVNGAKSRNHCFEITIQDAWELFLKQDRKCALTGVPIFFTKVRKSTSGTTASLDRINPEIGYTKENIQWTHKIVNRIKQNLHEKEFLEWCELLLIYKYKKAQV